MNSLLQKIKNGISNIIAGLKNSSSGDNPSHNTIWIAIFVAICILLFFVFLYLCCWVWMFVADTNSTQRIQLVSELRQFMVLLISSSAFTVFSGFLKFFVDKDKDGIPDVLEQKTTTISSSSSSSAASSLSSSSSSNSSSSTKTPLTTGTYNT